MGDTCCTGVELPYLPICPPFSEHGSAQQWHRLLQREDLVVIAAEDYLAYQGYSGSLNEAANVVLIPDAKGSYKPVCESGAEQPDMVAISHETYTIRISTGPGIPFPCFWGCSGGILVVGRTVGFVREVLRLLGKPSTLDMTMASAAFCMDALVGGRTYYTGITQTRMGEQLTFSLPFCHPTRKITWKPVFEAPESANLTIDQAARSICERLEDLLLPNGRVLLPLSGGLDSRLLACLLKRRGSELFCYTFQRGASDEAVFAQKVARTLRADHLVIDLPADCYGAFGAELALRTCGMITPMHAHLAYCNETMDTETRNLEQVVGYFGDPVTGSFQSGSTDPQNLDEVVKYTFCSMVRDSRLITAEAGRTFREALMEEIEAYSVPESRYMEVLKLVIRQQGLITHVFGCLEAYGKVIRPYVNGPFVDFCIGLPRPLRQNRAAFYKACRMMFPGLFSLPSGRRPDSGLRRRLDHFRRQWQKVKHYASWALLGPKNAWANRVSGENHDSLLAGELRDRVIESSKIVQEALGLPFQMPALSLYNGKHGYCRTTFGKVGGPMTILPQEMFRTITLAELLRRERVEDHV